MCGIIAAIAKRDIAKILLDGLIRLEYRGYDSAGLAIISKDGNLQCIRRVGRVNKLIKAVQKQPVSGNTGLAHTRWATHGAPTEKNAHPHISEHIVIVLNGIIENYEFIRKKLLKYNYVFNTQTDAEVIAHLINWEQHYNGGKLVEVTRRISNSLLGTYSIVIMDSSNPNLLVAAQSGSPLIIGRGIGENFLASDQIALLPVTKYFTSLEEGDIAEITCSSIKIWNKFGKKVKRTEIVSSLRNSNYLIDKGCYFSYMQKEIFEQPIVLEKTIKYCINDDKITLFELNNKANTFLSKVKYIQIVACGTSYHSGMISRHWFESIAKLPCNVEIASEFRYRESIVHNNSLLIAISQSGETADTLAALRLSKDLSYIGSVAVCNVINSSLVRESDISLITQAGIEISVASTKAFTTQLVMLLVLVIYIGRLNGMDKNLEKSMINDLKKVPNFIEKALLLNSSIKSLSKDFLNKDHALFLGRGIFYPIAMEGALKLKEISYIHAEAYTAGELKHGPLALIDENMPVIVIAPNNNLISKLKSNIEEIYARKGLLYIFTEKNTDFSLHKDINVIYLPNISQIIAPIYYVIPMQLLAYHIALIKGTNIDRPRNLAKSVTVE